MTVTERGQRVKPQRRGQQKQRERGIKQLTELNERVGEKRVSVLAAQLRLRKIERRHREKAGETERERETNTSQVFEVDHCRPNI